MAWRGVPWFRHRLAWRLCLLFVLGALIPVALSDWLVIAVTDGLADRMDGDRRARAVRAASRQVFDRIRLAEALLQSLSQAGQGSAAPAFDRLWCPRPRADAPSRSDAALLAAWDRLAPAAAARPQLVVTAGAPARVMLGMRGADGAACVGTLSEDYLWEPLRNAADDSVWSVRDGAGRLLAQMRGADADPALGRASASQTRSTQLFIAGHGQAQVWTFQEAAPPPRVDWHRLPVGTWLAAVAAATLLAVALVGQASIRRALAPLERLTASTRRLARGDAATRVDVGRDDEIGELALAFNEMAAKLQEREAQLYHQAVHDDLTGLTNRFGLLRELDALLLGGGADRELALLFVDLDRFKDVNDRHGHAVGDELLRQAAGRLNEIAGAGLLLARKGGDEFVLAVTQAGTRGRACSIADRIVAEMARPFDLADARHVCGASVGIALYPTHAADTHELLRCADIALYEAKRSGRGRGVLFDPAMDAAVRRRADLIVALADGLERRELVVHFQPRVDVASGRIESAEALVRWERPGHGLVPPGEFIELAETAGLIDALGRQVLEQALRQVAAWGADGLPVERVSVNVSPRQFESGQLVAYVREALRGAAVDPSRLELEVTESLLGGDTADARAQLAELRALGVTIAIDDFGTGYSSMALLRNLPIDVLKIDRAFVRDLEHDPSALAIARTIVTLGQALSLRLVAEGVETAGQSALLVAMGCDELQGWLYGRPVPPIEFAALPGLRVPLLAPPAAQR